MYPNIDASKRCWRQEETSSSKTPFVLYPNKADAENDASLLFLWHGRLQGVGQAL